MNSLTQKNMEGSGRGTMRGTQMARQRWYAPGPATGGKS